jgi:hypothetical protein
MCKSALAAGVRAAAKHGPERVRVVRFESLVTAPRETLAELCDWLTLSFDDAMLDVPFVQSSYAHGAEEGISSAPAERWRTTLSVHEVRTIEAASRSVMRDLGYTRTADGRAWPALLRALAALPADGLRALRANRARMGSPIAYVWRRLSFALGWH